MGSHSQVTLFQTWGLQNRKVKDSQPQTSTKRGEFSNLAANSLLDGGQKLKGDHILHELQLDSTGFSDDDDLLASEIEALKPDLHLDPNFSPSEEAENVPGFDKLSGGTYIYPTNYPIRTYQFDIIRKALVTNTLVVLPTGLGKTFLAAVVMYNFYRWYPQGKIVFMAPTKPLVAQQIEACFNIMGIPQKDTSEMTGSLVPTKREKLWREKRVFFMTPQVLQNDLSRGSCSAMDFVCLVFDEAHKALGNHAYCQVVREVYGCHSNFRVLALSATPGDDFKSIQSVVTNLNIAHVELRSEESPDIQPYVFGRKIEKIVVPLSDDLKKTNQLFMQVLEGVINRLFCFRVLWQRDPEKVSKFALLKSRDQFRTNENSSKIALLSMHLMNESKLCVATKATINQNCLRSSFVAIHSLHLATDPNSWCFVRVSLIGSEQNAGMIEGDFAMAISLVHAKELLQQHGVLSFYNFLKSICEGTKGTARTRAELKRNETFAELMTDLYQRLENPDDLNNSLNSSFSSSLSSPKRRLLKSIPKPNASFSSHPKLQKLEEIVVRHFTDFRDQKMSMSSSQKATGTRVMIFSQYRDSVQEITAVLTRHSPLVKVMSFIGQSAAGKSRKGLSQKEQIAVVNSFRKGGYNTLVSTSVGEEGLDIGDVDLIVCFDASHSPIRLVQRMGRTGRKRAGRIVILVTEGKEEQIYKKSLNSKKNIHKTLQNAANSLELFSESTRMVPRHLNPKCHKMQMTVGEYKSEKGQKRKVEASSTVTKRSSIIDALSSKQFTTEREEYLNGAELEHYNRYFKMNDSEPQWTILNSTSLTNWLPWQTTPQPSFFVTHSSRTYRFCEALEFMDLHRNEGEGFLYEKELQSYLCTKDVERETALYPKLGKEAGCHEMIGEASPAKVKVGPLKGSKHWRRVYLSAFADEEDDGGQSDFDLPQLPCESADRTIQLEATESSTIFHRAGSDDAESVAESQKKFDNGGVGSSLIATPCEPESFDLPRREHVSPKPKANVNAYMGGPIDLIDSCSPVHATTDCDSPRAKPSKIAGDNMTEVTPTKSVLYEKDFLSSQAWSHVLPTSPSPTKGISSSPVKRHFEWSHGFLPSPPKLGDLSGLLDLNFSQADSIPKNDEKASALDSSGSHKIVALEFDERKVREQHDSDPIDPSSFTAGRQKTPTGKSHRIVDTSNNLATCTKNECTKPDSHPSEQCAKDGHYSTKGSSLSGNTNVDVHRDNSSIECAETSVTAEERTFSLQHHNSLLSREAFRQPHISRTETSLTSEVKINTSTSKLQKFQFQDRVKDSEKRKSESNCQTLNAAHMRAGTGFTEAADPLQLDNKVIAENEAAIRSTKTLQLEQNETKTLSSTEPSVKDNSFSNDPMDLFQLDILPDDSVLDDILPDCPSPTIVNINDSMDYSLKGPLHERDFGYCDEVNKSPETTQRLRPNDNVKSPSLSGENFNAVEEERAMLEEDNSPVIRKPIKRRQTHRISDDSVLEVEVGFKSMGNSTSSPDSAPSGRMFQNPALGQNEEENKKSKDRGRLHTSTQLNISLTDDEDDFEGIQKVPAKKSKRSMDVPEVKVKAGKKRVCNDFIDDEAEESGASQDLEEDDNESQDGYMMDSFIDDSTQVTQKTPARANRSKGRQDMAAIYRQSLFSPRCPSLNFQTPKFKANRNRFKLVDNVRRDSTDEEGSEAEEVMGLVESDEYFSDPATDSFINDRELTISEPVSRPTPRANVRTRPSRRSEKRTSEHRRRRVRVIESSDEEGPQEIQLAGYADLAVPDQLTKREAYSAEESSEKSLDCGRTIECAQDGDYVTMSSSFDFRLDWLFETEEEFFKRTRVEDQGDKASLAIEKNSLAGAARSQQPQNQVLPAEERLEDRGRACTIIMDSRVVGTSQISSLLRLKEKQNVMVASQLGCDFIVSIRKGVLRRFLSDLSGNATSSKILETVRLMSKRFERIVLIIEKERLKGNTGKKKIVFSKHFSRVLTCLAECQVQVCFTENQEETAGLLTSFSLQEAELGYDVIQPSMMVDDLSQCLKAVVNFPRLNYAMALEVCLKVGNLSRLIASEPDDIMKLVPRIPKVVAVEIYKHCHHVFDPDMLIQKRKDPKM